MLIDIILLVVIVGGLLIGYHQGIFKMIGNIISFVLSLALAITLSATVANFVYNSFIQPPIVDALTKKVEETGAVETVEGIYKTINDAKQSIEGLTDKVQLPQIDTSKFDLTQYFGNIDTKYLSFITDNVDMTELKKGADSLKLQTTADPNSLTTQAVTAVTDAIKPPMVGILTPICFGLLFIIAHIILNIFIGIIIKVVDSAKVIEKTQKIAGLIVGGVLALALSLAAVLALTYLAPNIVEGSISSNIMVAISNGALDNVMQRVSETIENVNKIA